MPRVKPKPASVAPPKAAAKPLRAGAGPALDIRNRIRELRTVKAAELRKNPKNYRKHPSAQREVIRGLLQEVGYVDALLARETPDGLELIDGHMRSEVTPDMEVPVLICDLTDDEVDKVLVTLDPVSAMAETDDKLLKSLLASIQTDNADIRRFLTDTEEGLAEPAVTEPTETETKRDVPGMALEPHEHYDYLVVLCTTTQEWNCLVDHLELQPVERRGKMGVSRAVRASRLLEVLAKNAGTAR